MENYSTFNSHSNTVISHAGLPTRQNGVENRDKVYNIQQSVTACKPLSWNLCHVRPLTNVEFVMSAEHLF